MYAEYVWLYHRRNTKKGRPKVHDLRFRAWDKVTKCYWYKGFLIHPNGHVSLDSIKNPIATAHLEAGWNVNNSYEDKWKLELERYTGRKDKNGKKIYFNDIVLHECGGKGVIIWFDDRFGIASGEAGNYHAVDEITAAELEECIVIGNIYDNPGLLEIAE